MRVKETGNDYRYFPEPDIPYVVITDEMIENEKKNIPMLPDERRKKYQELGVSELNANKIRIDHAMIVRRNLSEIKIFAPFGLCQLLDPHGHPEMDSNVKKEYVELFKRYRDKLVPEIGADLFERKLEEISNK